MEIFSIDDERVGAVIEKREDEREIAVLLHIRSYDERSVLCLIAFQNGVIVAYLRHPVDVLHTAVLGLDVRHSLHLDVAVERGDGDCEQTVAKC